MQQSHESNPLWQTLMARQTSDRILRSGPSHEAMQGLVSQQVPLCLTPNETVSHVLSCRDPRARLQWMCSLDLLGVALNKTKSDPAITQVILLRLMHLHSSTLWNPLPTGLPNVIRRAAVEQDAIGWKQFL
jgi:hypothetical protein